MNSSVLFTVSVTICLLGYYVYTDTVDDLSITATAVVVDRFGWTTFVAVRELNQVSQTVNTTAGEVTTVDTVKMSLSLAPQV